MDENKKSEFEILESFENIDEKVRKNVTDTLMWEKPTRIQMAAIPVVLGKRLKFAEKYF